MALYLVQHGKCFSKEDDPERSLTKEGIAEVKWIANVAKGYAVSVSRIRHSGKKRALQSAELLAEALNPPGGIEEISMINPTDDPAQIARSLEPGLDLMLVGHLPHMEKLAAYLVTGNAERPIFKFRNGGIVCLDKLSGYEPWIITWALMPNIG
ncbi:MAG: phosphohistidine phosphatase SixA [bacterium]|nr:phosphohistidine phosphatase SixA [bacterium]